jgi:beta-phosphoglucomutase-like phosphatase (HAD superfamily)
MHHRENLNQALRDISLLRLPEGGSRHKVALDCDDTLYFTEETALGIVCECLNGLIRQSGFQESLDPEKFVSDYPGLTHPEIFKRVRSALSISATLPGWRDEDIQAFDEMATAKVIEAFESGSLRSAPDVDTLFEALHSRKDKFWIVSSSPLVRLTACVKGLGHDRYDIPLLSAKGQPAGSLPQETPKPDPAIYNLATQGEPGNWIAVEDSATGMRAAAAAMILKRIGFVGCVATEKQLQRAHDLFAAGALVVVKNHKEVLRIIEDFNDGRFGAVLERHGPNVWGYAIRP